jgi:hypothetical protein
MNKTENDKKKAESDNGLYRLMVDSILDCAVFMLDIDGRVCT